MYFYFIYIDRYIDKCQYHLITFFIFIFMDFNTIIGLIILFFSIFIITFLTIISISRINKISKFNPSNAREIKRKIHERSK